MAVFKSLTFDGINSLDYGIYITGEAVYNAPERAVEMVTIPGRNGALAIDQGYFENIEVSYPCGCFADTQADFAEKVSAFRNAIGSRYSYKRLTDEYNTDEYRLGLYKSGLEVSAVRYGTAGQFTITFDCKPQRFLLDGDAELSPTDYSDVHTVSGDIVQIENDGSLGVKSLTADIEPIQSLNGYDKPWAGGAGKNKLNNDSVTATASGITFTKNADGTVTANGTATDNATFIFPINPLNDGASYILNGCPNGGGLSTWEIMIIRPDAPAVIAHDYGSGTTFTYDSTTHGRIQIVVRSGQTVNNFVFKPMIRLASVSDATFEPYSNICPISGHTECVTSVSPTTSEQDATTYTTSLGRTVYGGTLDVVSGVLTVDRAMVDLGTLSWVYNPANSIFYTRPAVSNIKNFPISQKATAICDSYVTVPASGYNSGSDKSVSIGALFVSGGINVKDTSYTNANDFKSAVNGVQLCYELSTPQTYQLTPQEVELLLGTNNLWTDCGDSTVEYGIPPYYNPTEFDAKPLIKVTGRGTLGIGEYILTITGTVTQTLYIDCETMEIYTLEGTVPTGASSLVSINKTDFPVLKPGHNGVSVGTGLSALTITPRWWRI